MTTTPGPQASNVKPSDVARAHQRQKGIVEPTPHLYSAARRAFLKLENLQVTGAYKVRGAVNATACAIDRGDRRPVIAASAGNHGKGVAWAARHFGLAAHVVVPRHAPAIKIAGCRELGAEVIVHGDSVEESLDLARQMARSEGYRFVHPFDDAEVVAGQGTIAIELEELLPDVVLVPIGGGGLAAGVAVWLARRGVRVIGVQVVGVDAMRRSLRGEPLRPPCPTIADGLAVRAPGVLPLRLCRELLHDIVLVTEDQVRQTIVDLALHEKLVVEGAGAAAVAALAVVPGRRRIAIVTGGNLDPLALSELLSRPLSTPAFAETTRGDGPPHGDRDPRSRCGPSSA